MDRCANGHLRDAANLYVDPRGKRGCRQCRRDANRRSQLKRTGRASPWEPRKTVLQRLWSNSEIVGDCWVWRGYLNAWGYAPFRYAGRHTLAHRVSYMIFKGDYPVDKPETDHLCRNRACWNPDHLEAVTALENNHRSHAGTRDPQRLGNMQRVKTHCPQGHEYAGDNLAIRQHGARVCRICERAKAARYHAKKQPGRGVVW